MGSPTFDRQVFVKKTQNQRPPSRSPLPGALALLVVAALAAFATYRYVKAGGGVPFDNADKAQIEQLQQKIKVMQTRIEELQKGHRVSHVNHVADASRPLKTKSDSAKPSNALLAEVVHHPAENAVRDPHHSASQKAGTAHSSSDPDVASKANKSATPALKQAALEPKTLLASARQPSAKELNLLKSNLAANNDQWQATVDRLGNVVGQLDSQGNAIKKNQTNVNYLMALAHRTDIPFTLARKRRFQRVGPISMKLAGTSVKDQRYDIRLIVDDKSVELKDRALNEVVQFYTSHSKFPIQLIVSQIHKGEVSGALAVPQDLSEQLSNVQLQEK